jgi:two-component system sensor histidine kinase/response regulator
MKNQSNQYILIIDDNPLNLLLTNKILENYGYQSLTAESGLKGMAFMEQKLPSLILLDIMMPEMDGFEVCRIIKNNEKWKDIPIIFLTANSHTEDLIEGFEAGGVDYITKPFKSEELLVRVQNHLALSDSKKIILDMNRSRDKLYSIIAHDIRSPLSGILQTVDAIDQGYFDPSSADFKEVIHHLKLRTKETSTLLNSLLLWTRLQDDKMSIELVETNLNVIVNSCVQLLEASASNKNISLSVEFEEDFFAICNEVSIHTVLRNLISNSIKFTSNNGEIKIYCIQNETEVEVTVQDNGVGMSEDSIQKIFDKNEHFTSSGTDNEQGTGLGLMLVKDFVK